MNYERIALRLGLILVGFLCLYGAVDQIRKGETFGLSGKGRVLREEEPVYFQMLFFGRLVLGSAALLAGLFFPW